MERPLRPPGSEYRRRTGRGTNVPFQSYSELKNSLAATPPCRQQEEEILISDPLNIERKTPSPAEREARKVFRQTDALKAMTEHERAQRAFFENRDRLKALRLAREAQDSKTR
jgi:hypothetical protein